MSILGLDPKKIWSTQGSTYEPTSASQVTFLSDPQLLCSTMYAGLGAVPFLFYLLRVALYNGEALLFESY